MKLKKLQLNKQVVMNLNESEMNHLQGGAESYGILLPCVQSYVDIQCVTEYTGHTAPPRCCEYGCCETVGC